ncbi:MAG: UvrB/UvrC motif-containing protein [Parcubacteria group bacterium]|nr:UvrB/UvrC motif-containing protein [Parcubacteria group bacterium]
MKSESLRLSSIPAKPGVYFFLGSPKRSGNSRGRRGRILYIGKAGSLRDRVRSYFSKDIHEARGAGIAQMVKEARDVKWEITDSVLEALILEAKLIKKHEPKYNVRERDDKSFNYVVITDEDFPRIVTVREQELVKLKAENRPSVRSARIGGIKAAYGPFPHGGQLRAALSVVRKIFPFRDTCAVYSPSEKQKALHKQHPNKLQFVRMSSEEGGTPCFNRQIGLCPGVCTGEISKKEYAARIRNIRLLFEGKKKRLLSDLERGMKTAAKREDFERAAEIRNAMFSLTHIRDIAVLKHDRAVDKPPKGPSFDRVIHRIEAYDVAHTSGTDTVGVMVVVDGGETKKSDYRKFTVKTAPRGSDTGALKEVLERRLEHREWPLPRLVVVDGGRAQTNAAEKVLARYGIVIPVFGVVKDERHRPKKIIGGRFLAGEEEKAVMLANAEAHRFALRFHRAKRGQLPH